MQQNLHFASFIQRKLGIQKNYFDAEYVFIVANILVTKCVILFQRPCLAILLLIYINEDKDFTEYTAFNEWGDPFVNIYLGLTKEYCGLFSFISCFLPLKLSPQNSLKDVVVVVA